MKKSKKVIIGVVAFLVICGVIGSMSEKEADVAKVNINQTADATDSSTGDDTSTDSKDSSKDDASSKESKEESEVSEETATEPEKSAEAEETIDTFTVGDMAVTKKVNISFLDCGEYKESNQFLQPKDGMKYVYFQFEFENTSKGDYIVSSFECYADGYTCDTYYGGEDSSLIFNTISSGRKTKGTVYYEVPEDAKDIQLEYSYELFSNEKIVFQYK